MILQKKKKVSLGIKTDRTGHGPNELTGPYNLNTNKKKKKKQGQ